MPSKPSPGQRPAVLAAVLLAMLSGVPCALAALTWAAGVQDPDSRTVVNVAILSSGEVFNHRPPTGWFSLDLRSLDGVHEHPPGRRRARHRAGGRAGGERGFPGDWADIPSMVRAARHVFLLAAAMGGGE